MKVKTRIPLYITKHYRNYPPVLVRLPKVHPDALKRIFGNAWRRFASKRLVESFGR